MPFNVMNKLTHMMFIIIQKSSHYKGRGKGKKYSSLQLTSKLQKLVPYGSQCYLPDGRGDIPVTKVSTTVASTAL